MAAYATAADYTEYTGQATPPANVDTLLTKATRKVNGWLKTAVYNTDDAGNATDPKVIEALRDATCAQAEWFAETGDTTGAGSRFNSMALGPLSLSGGGTGSGTNTTAAASTVSHEAVEILTTAGLIGTHPTWRA